MPPEREVAIAGFFDKRDRLFTPTLASEWERPERVELLSTGATLESLGIGDFRHFGAELKICTSWSEPINTPRRSHIVRPSPVLLERFFELAGASDARVHKFAERYGGLEVFYASAPQAGDTGAGHCTVHIEYCDVWRYFAAGMYALLRIGATLYAGERPVAEDWGLIGNCPQVMNELPNESAEIDPLRLPFSNEEAWLSMAQYIRKRGKPFADEARRMFIRLVNTLLGLGKVRPWIVWPSGQNRPQLFYSGRSLLSSLALQLCLRVAKVDAFVLCTHCQKQYLPKERAPKAGQRNFCQECRKKAVPQQYALRDYRQKRREQAKGNRLHKKHVLLRKREGTPK